MLTQLESPSCIWTGRVQPFGQEPIRVTVEGYTFREAYDRASEFGVVINLQPVEEQL